MNTVVGVAYLYARRYDEAITKLNEVVALEPGFRTAHVWLAIAHAMLGRHGEAQIEYQRSASPEADGLGAWLAAAAGRRAEALEIIAKVDADPIQSRGFNTALTFLVLGENDRAVEILEQIYLTRNARTSLLKADPRLDGLRGDPRFQELLDRIGFPDSGSQ